MVSTPLSVLDQDYEKGSYAQQAPLLIHISREEAGQLTFRDSLGCRSLVSTPLVMTSPNTETKLRITIFSSRE